VLLLIALILFGVLAFRLWFLQILSGDAYGTSAQTNRGREGRVEAPRGVIYDRNGQILVENRAGLSVGLLPMDMIDPEEDPEGFQAEIDALATVLEISPTDLLAAYEKAKKDPYVTYTIKNDVPENTVVAYLKEHSLEFPGVECGDLILAQLPVQVGGYPLVGVCGRGLRHRSRHAAVRHLEAGGDPGQERGGTHV
jgi:penicillin-binding protein 2